MMKRRIANTSILSNIDDCNAWGNNQEHNHRDTMQMSPIITTPTKKIKVDGEELLSCLFGTASPRTALTPPTTSSILHYHQQIHSTPFPPLTVIVPTITCQEEEQRLQSKQNRRVRFQLPMANSLRDIFDDIDDMMIFEHSDHRHDADDINDEDDETLNKKELYYSKYDLLKSRIYAQRKARIIIEKYPDEIQALESVINVCSPISPTSDVHHANRKHVHQQIPSASNDSIGNDCDCSDDGFKNSINTNQQHHEIMCNWSNSYVRGLEDYMTPILRQRRRNVVQRVVMYYQQLRMLQIKTQTQSYHILDGTMYNDDITVVADALYQFSSDLTSPSRNFARHLAIGDALALSNI